MYSSGISTNEKFSFGVLEEFSGDHEESMQDLADQGDVSVDSIAETPARSEAISACEKAHCEVCERLGLNPESAFSQPAEWKTSTCVPTVSTSVNVQSETTSHQRMQKNVFTLPASEPMHSTSNGVQARYQCMKKDVCALPTPASVHPVSCCVPARHQCMSNVDAQACVNDV